SKVYDTIIAVCFLDARNFCKDFSNGYLFGEILHKYQMQEDFNMFLKSDSSDAKTNNFSRLEPTIKRLGVSFNKSTAQDLMQKKHGVATNLLYQLYVALEEKKPAGTSRVGKLPSLQKRESETQSYVRALNKCVRYFAVREVRDERKLEKSEKVKNMENKLYTFIFIIFSPSDQSIPADSSLSPVIQDIEVPSDKPDKVTIQSSTKYVQGIRQQLKENAVAREERQKRVDRFLLEQYKALIYPQQEQILTLEDQMVRRLTRQTQQEQRLAEQLMQIRRQKEVILENRLFREEQYKRQREKDFQEALDKEHAKLARAEEIEKEIEFCKMVAAERAHEKHMKHYTICSETLGQIVDMATTVGEYRSITENLVPEKKYKEWKELFIRGVPFYESQKDIEPEILFLAALNPSELKKEEVLNNLDYDEYTNMIGVWTWPKATEETKLPPSINDILAYAIQRIKTIAHPTVAEPATTVPLFSIKSCIKGKVCQCKSKCMAKIAEGLKSLKKRDFRIKACVLGKASSGKTTCLAKIAEGIKFYLKMCMASIAASVERELRKGNTIPNELIVDIVVDAISQVSAQSGWILDGFPTNIGQAQLLEKALGGFVEEEHGTEINTYELVPNPEQLKPPTPSPPVLDVALLLDISDECVIRRASIDKGTIMIAAFQDTWPELEKWYGEKQNILVNINADVEERELYNKVESSLCEVMKEGDSRCGDSSASEEQVPEYLCSHWKDVCNSYVNSMKHVMQQLRLQLTLIDRHLFNIRERYTHFLSCPDLKQELVSQWQKVFNSVPDDMREDEETKAELHLRLDELQERLWDITDKRKEEDQQERSAFMCDGWLEEQSALLINHYSMIIQAEMNRFRETLCTLAVYYWGMHKHLPLRTSPKDFSITLLKETGAEDQDKDQCNEYCGCNKMGKYLGVLNAARYFKHVLCTECFKFSVSSIDQLGEVVRYHIEASSKLQYELVMVCKFYLNGDCLLVSGVVFPPRPPSMEKPNRSILTVAQLESLFNHLFNMAPSGLCVHQRLIGLLLSLLFFPLMLIDWRRFLLSATLPWPLPSLSQLLYLLKQFKEADTDDTGYINEDQYLQVELWFPGQSVQKVPEDPLEPLPYDRSANLQKFFFQMFADHSSSPPLLDYVSMLQYFAANPNPKQGFIRALSVVLGKHLQQPLLSLLVNRYLHLNVQNLSGATNTATVFTGKLFCNNFEDLSCSPCSRLLNLFSSFREILFSKDLKPSDTFICDWLQCCVLIGRSGQASVAGRQCLCSSSMSGLCSSIKVSAM
uniref:Calponin-homology (CH) domain-containing protein n=1 Tax=Xiphophorus couchianus TaxID=32473 RepID=A0A3B5LL44_9TELE